MLPLCLLLKARGASVAGSDRSYDQGKNLEKFKLLQEEGIALHPQDGSGLSDKTDFLVVSSAIENTIPDVRVALEKNIPIIKRGALLAELFNQSLTGIAIAGTSGKSTVTGMIGTMLLGIGANPTIVNGGDIRNLSAKFSGVHVGGDDLFVAEMDESDGSIAAYNPTIAVLNNIALDHKSMDELETLFGDYLARAENAVVVNADHPKVMELVKKRQPSARVITYGLTSGDIFADSIEPHVNGISFRVNSYTVNLQVPGLHNVMNALAALGVAEELNLDMTHACIALEGFQGIHRRLEWIGTKNEITVIDDFAHNPDKIAASLSTLKFFKGRLIVMFQPHGFGPLKLMGQEMIGVFKEYLGTDDLLLMPEAYYAGGTVDRSITAKNLIDQMQKDGLNAYWFSQRSDIPDFIASHAKAGDRVVIMGARDDTLHEFSKSLLALF